MSTSSESAAGPAWRGDAGLGVAAWLAASGQPEPPPIPHHAVSDDPEPDHESVARKILLDQLTGRARSRAELADKLRSRNVPDDIATRLLDRFTELGLIDDLAFARQWVESRQSGRGMARRALAVELRRKGIDDEVAREALDQIESDDERAAGVELVRRKLRSMQRLDETTKARRLVAMLGRKGYPAGMSWQIVRDELGSIDAEPEFGG